MNCFDIRLDPVPDQYNVKLVQVENQSPSVPITAWWASTEEMGQLGRVEEGDQDRKLWIPFILNGEPTELKVNLSKGALGTQYPGKQAIFEFGFDFAEKFEPCKNLGRKSRYTLFLRESKREPLWLTVKQI